MTVTEWENEKEYNGSKVKVSSFTIQKSYKDGDEWKTTTSFNTNDLPRLIAALQRSFNNTILKEGENKE